MAEFVIANKEKLVAVADSVRTLSNTSTDLSLDEIDSKLNDANSAIEAIKTALMDKGVTVPDDADVLDIASLIAAIEAGGGGVAGYKMVSGSYTPAETPTANVAITHEDVGTGCSAVFLFVDHNNGYNNRDGLNIAATVKYISSAGSTSESSVTQYGTSDSKGYGSAIVPTNSTTITLHNNVYTKMCAGVSYTWVRFAYNGG